MPKIIYTKTDEAPFLATHSFLPIVEAFAKSAGISIETRDISLAARIIAAFPEYLKPEQQMTDDLAELGELAKSPDANIIKLPNISASVPQLFEAIQELQAKGYDLPNYPEEPKTDEEKKVKLKYDKIKGSAVNPILREGNSDRRAPKPVKAYARKNPHKMGAWSKDSQTIVSTMGKNDFAANEQSITMDADNVLTIKHTSNDGIVTILIDKLPVLDDEIIDATFLSKSHLIKFIEEQIAYSKEHGILFSLHMKATMMKVSDPIIFGEVIKVFFKDLFAKYGKIFQEIGVDTNNGFGDVLAKIKSLPADLQAEIEAEIQKAYENGPKLAMVDSDKGITNLNVPSDVIIDASMPAMIRSSGKMWDAQGKLLDTNAVIPDSSYAAVYEETIAFCKEHGAFDPVTMGSVPNVGLMAQKAEEYGSHDKTFKIAADGKVEVINPKGMILMSHNVEKGDIWRMCQVKDLPIQDWVKLAYDRAKATGTPAVFWLDSARAHDRELIKKVNIYLRDYDIRGLEISIKSPKEATRYSLERIREGLDTISVTGNVLRDYLTDLFPILELGTSAKMLSIVPLMNGGGLFETGAGGSAPKHVEQFLEENHLRWDSLGEFLALAVSLDFLGDKYKSPSAKLLGETLDTATTMYLNEDKSPGRDVGQLDNRGSHFYVAMYWAKALAEQNDDQKLKTIFTKIATELETHEDKIVNELNVVQGNKVDIEGYYLPTEALTFKAMRPSETFNEIIESIK